MNVTDSLTRSLEIIFSKMIPSEMQSGDMKIDEVYFAGKFGNLLKTYNKIKTTPEAEKFLKAVFDQQNLPHCSQNHPCISADCITCVELYKFYLHRSRLLKKRRSLIYYEGLVYSFFLFILIPSLLETNLPAGLHRLHHVP